MQTARTLKVVVEDPNAREPLLFRHAVEQFVDDLAEIIAIFADAGRSVVCERALVRLRGLQHFDGLRVPALFEISNRHIDLQRFVRMWAALGSLDSRRHRPLDDQRVRPIVGEDTAKIDVQGVKVLAHRRFGGEAIARQGAAQIVADHVLLRVAGNGHVVVIDQ